MLGNFNIFILTLVLKLKFNRNLLIKYLKLKIITKNNSTNFSEFIKDKSLVLVGPANYLSYLNQGTKIDDFDLVCRINRGAELIPKFSNQLGSRTDILFNCLIEKNENGGKISLNFLKKNNIKWICTIPYSDLNGNVIKNKLHPEVRILTKLKLKYFFNLHIYDSEKYSSLNKSIRCRANTGFSAIFDLLDNGANNIYITGFSFYLDSFMRGYKKNSSISENKIAEDCFVSTRHNQFNQWSFLKTKINDPRLKFDPILEQILKLEKLDKNKFKEIIEKIA